MIWPEKRFPLFGPDHTRGTVGFDRSSEGGFLLPNLAATLPIPRRLGAARTHRSVTDDGQYMVYLGAVDRAGTRIRADFDSARTVGRLDRDHDGRARRQHYRHAVDSLDQLPRRLRRHPADLSRRRGSGHGGGAP